MAYQDKFGITDIELEIYLWQKISISWDILDEIDEAKNGLKHPVFLFISDTGGDNHDHIVLTVKGARDLRDWLTAYLHDVGEDETA